MTPPSFDRPAPALVPSATRSRRTLLTNLATALATTTVADDAAAARRCRNGRARCDGRCRDLAWDRDRCGDCANACDANEACVEGDCCTPGDSGCVAVPRRPFPQHETNATGTIKPDHYDPDELDDHVRDAYQRWKDRYLVFADTDDLGLPLYRVTHGKPGTALHDETVSEGQGYGMIIAAHLAGHDPDAQTIFDGLWRFARRHPSRVDDRLMDWRVPGGVPNSAFDGDCDMAYALLLADAQWPAGGFSYAAEATRTLVGILASTIGPTSRLPLLGDWVLADDDGTYTELTVRSSDFIPGHFRAFGRFTGDDVWTEVADACRDTIGSLQASHSPQTGLLPDFIVPQSRQDPTPRPATPHFLEGPHDGHFEYNACRDPWRLATDALLNANPDSLIQARRMSHWIEAKTGGDPAKIRAGYRLNGDQVANYFSTAFAAPFAVAAMLDPGQQAWLNAVFDAVRSEVDSYYEDSIALLCLLVMTGNFWDPTL